MQESSYVEAVVAKVSDLQNGEMKEVVVSDNLKVLLVKENDQYKAVGNRCTHYGAPLKTGVFANGHVRCPWHGACFNVTTGDIEDYPGLDKLHTFEVRIEGDNVIVRGRASDIQAGKTVPTLCSKSASDARVFAVVGGGPAGITCVETLRAEGFAGSIVFFCKEKLLPYDRTKLSKAMSIEHEKIVLRDQEYFNTHGIDLRLGVEVTNLDAENSTLHTSDGGQLKYDAVFVATGGHPRQLKVPGHDLANIFTLRELHDAHAISASVEDKDVVLIGSSFIGMEVAACLAGKAKSLTVVGMEKVPFERVLGYELGGAYERLHASKGVAFRMGRTLIDFRGQAGKVTAVTLDGGEALPADIVVVGAGAIPATGIFGDAEDSGVVNLARDDSLVTDEFLCAGGGNIYVGGDIARFPYWLTGEMIRVEHWQVAQLHGRIAAKNMVKPRSTPVRTVPFFWTLQFGKSLRYAGFASSYDQCIVDGDLSALNFVVYYVRDDKLIAVAAMGRDPIVSALAELMAANKVPPVDQLKGQTVADYQKLLL